MVSFSKIRLFTKNAFSLRQTEGVHLVLNISNAISSLEFTL